MKVIAPLLIGSLLILTACTSYRVKRSKLQAAHEEIKASLAEESKALTTGVVDVLSQAPTNRHSEVALSLARQDQQIEGLPERRIAVEPLLAQQEKAIRELEERFAAQLNLLREQKEAAAMVAREEQKLIGLGEKYEETRNKSIIRRFFAWALGTLGIGGIILICLLCPAAIPLITNLVGWLVNKIPSLSSWLGVVSRKAFDSVVEGVGNYRAGLKEKFAQDELGALNTELLKATDAEHRKLIEDRRAALKV